MEIEGIQGAGISQNGPGLGGKGSRGSRVRRRFTWENIFDERHQVSFRFSIRGALFPLCLLLSVSLSLGDLF